MAGIRIEGTSGLNAEVSPAGALRGILYDINGNVLTRADKSVAPAGASPLGYLPNAGLDGGIIRALRVGEFNSLRTTSEVILFHDGLEGSVNTWWTQTVSTATISGATAGMLILNNSGVTGANNAAQVVLARQFAKYPRCPLFARFRANISANVAGNHTVVELGFGSPSGVTAIINNGAFFRWKTDGTLWTVVSYNGTETQTQVLAQGVINTSNYYYYDVIMDDDYARFIVSDAAGTPVVDATQTIALTSQFTMAVSHIPTFARVYVDSIGGGTVVKLNISAHQVMMLDTMASKPWAEQLSGAGRSWSQLPTTQAQSAALASAAPAGGTPSNTATVYTTLGGEYIATMTAASENMLSLFGFVVTSPYTFYVKSLYWSLPYVSTAFNIAATQPFILPFMIANASSANISTATGKIGVPMGQMWTAAIAAAAGTLLTGNPIMWTPATPIACLPGRTLHLGWKVLNGGAVTAGAIRGAVLVDGYWE